MIKVPILLIGFNRPDNVKVVFENIRKASPQKLYVALDGPRVNIPKEKEKRDEVENIVKNIDWDCSVHYSINEINNGAEVTISNAITWVLKKEEFVIVLEDDIIAPLSFLNFAQDMLYKYKDNHEIAMISGCNFTPIPFENEADYTFGIYGHTWGWATWRRAWQKYDLNIDDFTDYLQSDLFNNTFPRKIERIYTRRKVKKMIKKGAGNNTWDRCWWYIRLKYNMLSIIPRANLTSNIGILGLHAKGKTEHHFREYDENFEVMISPIEIKRNLEYDLHHFKNYLFKRIPLSELIKIVKNKILKR